MEVQVQASLRLLLVFLATPGLAVRPVRGLGLAFDILPIRGLLRCAGFGLVVLGVFEVFRPRVGEVGRLPPPGQALKMWTSFTRRPRISGGLAQVARTFRLTFSIHLGEKKQINMDIIINVFMVQVMDISNHRHCWASILNPLPLEMIDLRGLGTAVLDLSGKGMDDYLDDLP